MVTSDSGSGGTGAAGKAGVASGSGLEGDGVVIFDPSTYDPVRLQRGLTLPKKPIGYVKVDVPAHQQKGGMLQWRLANGWLAQSS